MNATTTHDIRGVLISVSGGKLLLPNASVAEVITYSDPEPVPGAPSWLLGRVRWRGWALPIVSYSRLVGWSSTEVAALGAKVAVLKAVGQHSKMPYFAVLTQGFPRLVTIAESALVESDDLEAELPDGVYSEGVFNDDYVVVPDLPNVETQIVDVLLRADAVTADVANA
jgi:chemosensory pili system protein ChpC